jgi:transposase
MKIQLTPKINEADMELIQKLISGKKLQAKFAIRLLVILNRASNKTFTMISQTLNISISSAIRYIKRYNTYGIQSLLKDKTRKPGKAPISEETKNGITRIVCNEPPKNATHWSVRGLAKRVGISKTSVNKILQERGLKPHLAESFQFSNDVHFEEKLKDVVGLYMNPPNNAILLRVDEKSQIQALERSTPILPILQNVPERQSHDYFRHGTTTLFAAPDVLTGEVIGECKDQHKAADYIEFLQTIDRKYTKGKTIHIVADNYATHKTKKVKEYIDSKPQRFVMHFIPTHSSWLNLVERWFAEITSKRIRRGSWESVKQLTKAIKDFIRDWNKTGKPFRWTKSSDTILDSINKARESYSF